MATLILGTIGRAVGGPIGGIVGTFLGAAVDRAALGGGGRDGPRLGDLAVQSSAYGEALPRLYGRMRVAGNLIWSPGIREIRAAGGGKSGGAATSYSYSASFAVALSARRITGIGRIWADGKLLRDAAGIWLYPATMRLHLGDERQSPDPLIVAAEGIGKAPAYRGIAYVVFDDLPLADYANRIPNLTFEVVADAGETVDIGTVVGDITAGRVRPTGDIQAVHGFAATRAGAVRVGLEPLVDLADLVVVDDGNGLAISARHATATIAIAADDLGAAPPGKAEPRHRDRRAAASSVADAVTIGFADPARDYQYGLQRACRRTPVVHVDQRDLPVALRAPDAKQLAEAMLARAVARRTTADLHLPWRYAGVPAGTTVTAAGRAWRVRSRSLVGMIVELAVESVSAVARAAPAADSGRVLAEVAAPPGDTVIEILDLPPLPGPLPTGPLLWIAAAGTGAGWRRAEVLVSRDGGDSYVNAATIGNATVMGTADTVLPPSSAATWDRDAFVDVTLLHPGMWLTGRSTAAVLADANLALVGDEIIQFTTATAIAPGRLRLSGLLRGRRGTEAAMTRHRAGERFVCLDPVGLTGFDPGADAIGTAFRFKANGGSAGNTAAQPIDLTLAGRALQPLRPVHLTARRTGDGIAIGWIRCSRAGFNWPGGSDVPLAEEAEAYRLTLQADDRAPRTIDAGSPAFAVSATELAGIRMLHVRVAQIGAVTGAGPEVARSFAVATL